MRAPAAGPSDTMPRPAPAAAAYRAPRWLRGAHAQTIWPALAAPRPQVRWARTRWTTPDGDFIDVDLSTPAQCAPQAPLLVLFHGLEGSSDSPYARAVAASALRRGWRTAVPHFRGCSGPLNLAPRAYHSGDSDEIDWILRRFAAEHPQAPLLAAGVSLGGNALLKWIGERGIDAGFVRAAVAVSPPQDLAEGARALSRGFNRVYTRNFLRTLKRKSQGKLAQYPGLFDNDRMLAARDFFDFDDAVTAPMHGFADCHDYWARSSCRQFLGGIRIPTLVINALNDPFLPPSALARAQDVSRFVLLDYPREGGHVGFLGGAFPGRFAWLPDRMLGFLAEHLTPEPPHG